MMALHLDNSLPVLYMCRKKQEGPFTQKAISKYMLLTTRYEKKGVYIDSRVDCSVSAAAVLWKSC